MPRVVVIVAVLVAAAVIASPLSLPDADAPRSATARSAIIRFEKASDDAEKHRDAAIAKAAQQAVDDLTKARMDVMKQGGQSSLEEANRIQKAIDAIGSPTGNGAKSIAGTYRYRSGRYETDLVLQAGGAILEKGKAWEGHRWRPGKGGGVEIAKADETASLVPFFDIGYVGAWGDGGPVSLLRK